MILTFEGSVYSQFYSNESSYQNSSSVIYYTPRDDRTVSDIYYKYAYYDNSGGFYSTAFSHYETYIYSDYTADTTTFITIISSTVYSESRIYNATELVVGDYGYTTETVIDVISIVSTYTDTIIYVPTVINNYSEYTTINTTTLIGSQLSTTSSTLTVELSTYSFTWSHAGVVKNTYVYASEGFYIASNSSHSAIFQSPTTTYTSYELFPITTSYTRSVIDLSRKFSETSLYTETVFGISYEGDTPYTTCSLVSVVDSFPQTTDGTYSVYSRHLSTTLITTQTVTDFISNRGVEFSYVIGATSTGTFGRGDDTSSGSSGETYMPGDTVKTILDNAPLLSGGILVSSYVGSGIDIPSAGWSYSDRTSIPAWFSGGAEISLDGHLFDYISTSIIVPSIGTRYAEKADSSFTVSIDSLFNCSSTWRYPVGTSTQTSSATMKLEAQGANQLLIDTASNILGGYPEINHAYTFVRGLGAFAVTNGDAYGFTTTTQSFTNTDATSFSSTMNNTITEISQYPLILGLSVLPVMTYDF